MDKVRLNLNTGKVELLEDVLRREIDDRDVLIDHILEHFYGVAKSSDHYRSRCVKGCDNKYAKELHDTIKYVCSIIGHDTVTRVDGGLLCVRCDSTFPK